MLPCRSRTLYSRVAVDSVIQIVGEAAVRGIQSFVNQRLFESVVSRRTLAVIIKHSSVLLTVDLRSLRIYSFVIQSKRRFRWMFVRPAVLLVRAVPDHLSVAVGLSSSTVRQLVVVVVIRH